MEEDIYLKLPSFLQNFLCSLHGRRVKNIRYGSTFDSVLCAAHQRTIFAADELKTFQNNRLLSMFSVAASSPYWSRIFSDYGVNPIAEDGFAELNKLPVLTKSDIQDCCASLVPNKSVLNRMTRYPLVPVKTSGTTGAGLRFFSTREAEKERWATWWRYRQSNGIEMTMWCLTFAGRAVVSPLNRQPPFWRYNYPGKQILFSSYHLNQRTADLYLKKICDTQAPWVHGYPSFLAIIARFALDHGVEFPDVRFVTTGAEQLHDFQRSLIEKAFKTKVLDHYGQAEGVANFSQFSGRNDYVVDEDYSFVEFEKGPDSFRHRILGTNLVNPAFPLFRYEVGDLATPSVSTFSSYGSFSRGVDVIEGRSEDYLILSDGSTVGRLDHIFKGLAEVVEAQFIQDSVGKADLLYVSRDGSDELLREKIMLMVDRYLGDKIDLNLISVSSVPRTSSGKIKFVVSKSSLRSAVNS